MEVRQQRVDAAELEARRDEELGPPGERGAARDRLEDTDGRRPDGENAARSLDPPPGLGRDLVALAVQLVVLEPVGLQRPERIETDVQREIGRASCRERVSIDV